MQIAVHPQHGVIWTDGKAIYLAPIQVEGHQIQNAASVKLGEFENVTSVHWSNITEGDTCHLCVVHQQNVTVWRVSGALPKLSFKQVRKINVRPVPQGCLWNPCNDVLCLLSRHQCSFYYRHDQNKASYAFPVLENGSIACGCWSPDGSKLVLCVGAALLIYRWSDVNAKIDDFAATAWRIPALEGKLTSIAPVLRDSVVVAAEIPLENLCKQQDMFKVPDIYGDSHHMSDDVIRPNKVTSVTDSLLNLQQNAQAVPDSRSSLTIIHLPHESHDPTKLSTVPLKGAVTTDILLYEKNSQCVVVGSNSQSHLQIFALLDKHLAHCGNIQLEKGQRPKGLCSMPSFFDDRGAAILILVGQREVEESGIAPPTLESEFSLSLKYIILKAGHSHHPKHSGRGDGSKDRLSGHTKSSSLVRSEKPQTHHVKNLSDPSTEKLSNYGQSDHQVSPTGSSGDGIKLSPSSSEHSITESGIVLKPPSDRTFQTGKIIEDLSSDHSHPESLDIDTVAFSSQVPSFNNSKFAATYKMDPAFNSKQNDITYSSHQFSLPKDRPVRGETVKDIDSTDKASSVSKEIELVSATDISPPSSQVSQKANDDTLCSAARQGSHPGDSALNVFHSQKNLLNNVSEPYVSKENKIFSNSASDFLQTEKESVFTRSPSEKTSQTTSKSLLTGKDSSVSYPSLQSEIKLEIASLSSQLEQSSIENVSILHSDKISMTDTSHQHESGSFNLFSSSQGEIQPQKESAHSLIEQKSPSSIQQLDMKSETESNLQQDNRNYQINYSNLKSVIKPQVTSSSVQAAEKSSGDPYSFQSNLLSNRSEGRIELSDLSHSPRAGDLDHGKEETLSDHGLGNSQHSVDSIWDALEKQTKSQKDSIRALYQRLESLSETVDKTACVFPAKYQDMNKPEIVEIYCEKPEGTETKKFLLDNGRLQLDPIKLAFGLSTVELWLDGMPCVLGANIDGYIPLKFTPFTKLHISGRPVDT